MASVTVIVMEPAKYRDGEMIAGPSQSSETSMWTGADNFESKLQGLNIRSVNYQSDPRELLTLAAQATGNVSLLALIGKDRDKATVFVFINSGSGPSLGI